MLSMRPAIILIAVCLLPTSANASLGKSKVRFDIPPSNLSASIPEFGRQAGITIGSDDRRLSSIRSQGVHGKFAVDKALAKLLAHTGFTFVAISDNVIRIVRAPAARKRPIGPPPMAAV